MTPSAKPDMPRGYRPVIKMVNHVTITTTNEAMPGKNRTM